MLSLEYQGVFQSSLLFLSFIKMVDLIHLFCYTTNRFTTGPLGNSEFCSLDFVSGNIEILGEQNSLFPSGPANKC